MATPRGPLGVIAALGALAALALPAAAAADTSVAISDSAYKPAMVTIEQGEVVTWTNDGKRDHTVTSGTGTTMKRSRPPHSRGPAETELVVGLPEVELDELLVPELVRQRHSLRFAEGVTHGGGVLDAVLKQRGARIELVVALPPGEPVERGRPDPGPMLAGYAVRAVSAGTKCSMVTRARSSTISTPASTSARTSAYVSPATDQPAISGDSAHHPSGSQW
jgi:hypothetical protein